MLPKAAAPPQAGNIQNSSASSPSSLEPANAAPPAPQHVSPPVSLPSHPSARPIVRPRSTARGHPTSGCPGGLGSATRGGPGGARVDHAGRRAETRASAAGGPTYKPATLLAPQEDGARLKPSTGPIIKTHTGRRDFPCIAPTWGGRMSVQDPVNVKSRVSTAGRSVPPSGTHVTGGSQL